MGRETKSGLLSKRKTNAEKMKEAREAKAKDMEANTEPVVKASIESEPTSITTTQAEFETPAVSDLASIGKAAGSAVQEKPEGYRLKYVETKTKRVQLVFQPSLHERIKKAAKKYNLSVNEYVHQILDNATPHE